MKDILGWLFLVLGVALLASAGYLLILSLGYRKGRTAKTTAWLAGSEHMKRLYTKRGFVKDAVNVRYDYTIAGKTYRIESRFLHAKPQNMPQRTRVTYQKRNPARAFLELQPVPTEPILCGVSVFLAVIFTVCGLVLLL